MPRLVVVSNRVADLRKPAAGGLAVALGDALRQCGGLWFGWSGATVEGDGPVGEVRVQRHGEVTMATLDLSSADIAGYYLGYSNGVLWPVFHYRLDLAAFDTGLAERYRHVNRLLASKLHPLLRPDDIVWVHDYQLIPFASELRALGSEHRIGFFLHIPLPPPLILAAIPEHRWLMRALFAYDLVGFQSRSDLAQLEGYLLTEAGVNASGDGVFEGYGRRMRAEAFPIGIDVDDFRSLADRREALDTLETLNEQYSRRQILVGVDRLDYSKGLPQRVHAFRNLLQRHPENQRLATLIQVAAPSREGVGAYAELKTELERLCGAINGDHGELDWMPVRYIHRTVARRRIPGLYRAARAALVTPLRDGMNLVAKEFLAVQDPADPGVLVLSRFAGAAEQLRDAVLVNPYATDETADAIQLALHMPLDERRSRHARLMAELRRHDVHWWRKTFLDQLRDTAELSPASRPRSV